MLSFTVFLRSRRYFAPAFLFFCFAMVFSTWVTYIPVIVDKLEISEGQLGVALFFASLGSFLMIPVSNKLIDVLGVGRQTFFGFIFYATSVYGMFLAPTYILLCIALFYFGMMSSVFVIALNSLLANVELKAGRNIMTGSHGFWSVGGIVGASSGGFLAGKIGMPVLHLTVLLSILITAQIMLRNEYYHIKGETPSSGKKRKFPVRPLLAVAIIGLILMASEGAIADWSALFLQREVELEKYMLGFGYALFSLGMTIGRFTGDALSFKLGSWKLLRIAIGTSLIGFVLVLNAQPTITLAGFMVIGLGFSVIVPEIYRLASRIEGVKTSDGVSFIAAVSNVGFLIGPVFLGLIAEVYSLLISFFVLSLFVCFAFIISLFKK
ncbi:MFS transporter [Natronoflexus pectinivorans]|uniref:Fucose permease n=1 Tax=Natronoflexus pectinivorans TaxID=682526 RepID=A0A4R2GKC1_9BACT|nr:MFS transporter [Natronoflexus pectinivorans]TCO09293.1 fucose permease [Natronoflexus pectinivorans]